MVGRGNRALLVLCLVLLGRAWARARVLENNPKSNDSPLPAIVEDDTIREISEDFFEGDIALTKEQKLLLQERKAINPSQYWPKDSNNIVTIGYRFGDDVIDRPKVMVSIDHWEQNTCIRFQEVSSKVGYTHLNFTDAPNCASFVGRINSMTAGQTVWLHKSCVNNFGSTVHEIGHALGFSHEQSRSDRDDYVQIMWQNIKAGAESNFGLGNTFNYEVPYDYSSVMHYGAAFFSANKEPTILALEPMAQSLMGERSKGLSFADKLLANLMYDCIDQWLTECSITTDPCQNLGYTGPDCACVCPPGTKGAQCEILNDKYIDAVIKLASPNSERITSTGVVSTPGYPTPIQERTTFTKVLKAPNCHQVQLTFSDFHVYRRNGDGNCATDGLTIQTADELDTGTLFCGVEIAAGTVFTSETDTIVLDYYNYDYTTVTWDSQYRGFRATIEHIPTSCVTIINSGDIALIKSSSSTGSCGFGGPTLAGAYEFTSPGYSFWYWPGLSCSDDLETSGEPRYLRVTATDVRVGSSDVIAVTSLFGNVRTISTKQAGNSHVFLTSSVNIFFKAHSWWFGRRFKLSITVENSDCHQILRMEAGGSGTLTKTDYATDTVCEWWIQAPSGSEIRLDFTAFDVGQSNCSGDYLVIDTSGDRRYGTAVQKYCGTNIPGSVTSTGGQLNVLLNGLQGGHPGFTATYTIV